MTCTPCGFSAATWETSFRDRSPGRRSQGYCWRRLRSSAPGDSRHQLVSFLRRIVGTGHPRCIHHRARFKAGAPGGILAPASKSLA